jgi:hypothetical protein
MLVRTRELDELDRAFARTHTARLDYETALRRFTALWVYARKIRPDFPTFELKDLEADVELARVLNARPG